jgi:hypothetical protein
MMWDNEGVNLQPTNINGGCSLVLVVAIRFTYRHIYRDFNSWGNEGRQ